MTRVVVFCAFIVAVVLVFNLDSFNDLRPSTERFSFDKVKEDYLHHQKMLAELEKMRVEREHSGSVKELEEQEEVAPAVILDTPQLVNGNKLFAKCIVCHGKEGQGKKSQNAPKIGGQMSWYLLKQLTDMKNGVRVNKVMDPYIKNLTDQDMSDLSSYLSKIPW